MHFPQGATVVMMQHGVRCLIRQQVQIFTRTNEKLQSRDGRVLRTPATRIDLSIPKPAWSSQSALRTSLVGSTPRPNGQRNGQLWGNPPFHKFFPFFSPPFPARNMEKLPKLVNFSCSWLLIGELITHLDQLHSGYITAKCLPDAHRDLPFASTWNKSLLWGQIARERKTDMACPTNFKIQTNDDFVEMEPLPLKQSIQMTTLLTIKSFQQYFSWCTQYNHDCLQSIQQGKSCQRKSFS